MLIQLSLTIYTKLIFTHTRFHNYREVQSSQCTNPAQADKVLNILQEFWLGQHSEFGEFVQVTIL